MCRVLIADDEELVRRGLAALLEREAPEVIVVGSAIDGVDALEQARDTAPDIVLTDIRMPGLDGLDLIDRLREDCPDTRCIVLSGYDDFGYARRAIGLGVEDYLLKPVDADELLALLARVQVRIVAVRRDRAAQAAAARLAAEHAVRRVLDGLTTTLPAAAFPPAPAWGLVLLRPLTTSPAGAVPAPAPTTVPLPAAVTSPTMPSIGDDGLLAACRAVLPAAIVVEDAYGYLCALLPLGDDDREALAADALRLLAALRTRGHDAAAVVARPYRSSAAIRLAYDEALETAEYGRGLAVALASGRPVLCWETPPAHADHWPVLPACRRDALLDAVALGDEQGAIRAARAFMAYALLDLAPGATRALWVELAVLVVHAAQERGVHADELLNPQRKGALLPPGTAGLAHLDDELRALAARAARACRGVLERRTPRGGIAELRAYVEANPAADLSIGALAARVHLNAKYLGEIFKAETGEPLGEYVIRTRMRHASRLLATTSLKVYAVAEQVGYSSPRHFATMFRSLTGLSPADYRERRREGTPPEGEVREAGHR